MLTVGGSGHCPCQSLLERRPRQPATDRQHSWPSGGSGWGPHMILQRSNHGHLKLARVEVLWPRKAGSRVCQISWLRQLENGQLRARGPAGWLAHDPDEDIYMHPMSGASRQGAEETVGLPGKMLGTAYRDGGNLYSPQSCPNSKQAAQSRQKCRHDWILGIQLNEATTMMRLYLRDSELEIQACWEVRRRSCRARDSCSFEALDAQKKLSVGRSLGRRHKNKTAAASSEVSADMREPPRSAGCAVVPLWRLTVARQHQRLESKKSHSKSLLVECK